MRIRINFAPDTGDGGGALLGAAGGQGGADGGQGGAAEWTAGLDDAGKASIAKNGYKSLGDLVKAHDNFQRQFGADKIALPGKDAKAEEWDPVWNRLGRPEKAEGYQLKKPDGAAWYSDEVAKAFATAAHKAGVTQAAAAAMHDWYVADMAAAFKAAETAEGERHTKGRAALTEAWGKSFDENLEFANRALADPARKLNIPELHQELKTLKLDSATGIAKLLAMVGRLHYQEDNLIGGGARGGGLTPEQAKGEIERLRADKEWAAAYNDKRHPGYRAAREKHAGLYKIAYPEGSGA